MAGRDRWSAGRHRYRARFPGRFPCRDRALPSPLLFRRANALRHIGKIGVEGNHPGQTGIARIDSGVRNDFTQIVAKNFRGRQTAKVVLIAEPHHGPQTRIGRETLQGEPQRRVTAPSRRGILGTFDPLFDGRAADPGADEEHRNVQAADEDITHGRPGRRAISIGGPERIVAVAKRQRQADARRRRHWRLDRPAPWPGLRRSRNRTNVRPRQTPRPPPTLSTTPWGQLPFRRRLSHVP